MVRFPLENKTLYYLADTTTSTTDSFENQDDDVMVGGVVDAAGKKAVEQADAFAIVSSINGNVSGKVIGRHFSAYSAGRVWVETSEKPTLGALAHYTKATGKYGSIGDIVVGRFLTANDAYNVVQIDFSKGE